MKVLMSELTFTSAITVEEIQHVGSDATLVAAARVSTRGWDSVPDEEAAGLLRYLMKHRHGTPFEHASLTVRVHAPIFVWRQWQRHRWLSFNEESARYRQLEPVFWVPAPERPIMQAGSTPARPCFLPATNRQHQVVTESLRYVYQTAYDTYERLLAEGVGREVARACLPVGIYSSCWVTGNVRAWLSFLSLRTANEHARYVSYPQAEIADAAHEVEVLLRRYWPLTWQVFQDCGRVAP